MSWLSIGSTRHKMAAPLSSCLEAYNYYQYYYPRFHFFSEGRDGLILEEGI